MINVTAMTCLCADIFDGTDIIRPGGEALNFAAAASVYPHLNLSLIGAVGDDGCGREILYSVSGKPIDTSCVHVIMNGKTASNRTYLTDKGDRYYKSDSWNGGVYQTFKLTEHDVEKLYDSDIVHTNFSCPNFYDILSLKDKCGFMLSVDFDAERNFDSIPHVLDKTDFLFVSADNDLISRLDTMSGKYSGIFTGTLAEKGSVSFHKGKKFTSPAVPVTRIADTTGCGDSYQAGFIGAYTLNGNISEAMTEGSKAASITLSHMGGFLY